MKRQLLPFPLNPVTYTASQRSTIDLSVIPPVIAGMATKIEMITAEFAATPTLSSGTATPEELQNAVSNIVVQDSVRKHYDGPLSAARLIEAYERGALFTPEPDAAATTEAVNFQRVLWAPPPLLVKPEDFGIPGAACGQGASIDISYGALTAVDANCTALTMTITPIVWLSLNEDMTLPPMLERKAFPINNEVPVTSPGPALILFAALCDSISLGAITAGDFTNFTLSSLGVQTKRLPGSALNRAYHEQMHAGPISQIQGEPKAATDDNPKVVNGTALAAATANVQPLVWMPKGSGITKCITVSRNEFVVAWSGTQAAGYLLLTRVLQRTADLEKQYLSVIQQKLGKTLQAPKIDTVSKSDFNKGDFARFMPVKYKF